MSSSSVITMKSKPSCQSARRLALARPCVQMTEEVDFISFRERERQRGRGVRHSLRLADSTSREQVCSMACMASCPSPDIQSYFRVPQPWPCARFCVTEITVDVLSPTCYSLPLLTCRKKVQFSSTEYICCLIQACLTLWDFI